MGEKSAAAEVDSGAGAASWSESHAAESDELAFSWPHNISRRPTWPIGKAVERLKQEFPAITISKLRFLEEIGIVCPARTGSGYRKFSPADVERLRYALSIQRDTCQPWQRIADLLADLDAGRVVRDLAPTRMVARDGKMVAPVGRPWVTVEELMTITGVVEADLAEIEKAGLAKRDSTGVFPSRAISVVAMVLELRGLGVPVRNMQMLGSAARQHAEVVNAVLAPQRTRNTAAAKEQAAVRATEIAQHSAALFSEILHHALEQSAQGNPPGMRPRSSGRVSP